MAENPFDQFDAIQPSLPAAQIKPIIAAPVKPEKGESAPSGYRYNAAGVLEPIPGGPADPNAPKPGAEKPTEAQGKVLTLLTRVAGGTSDIQNALKAEPEAQQAGLLETLSRNILGEGVVTRTIAGPERRIITDAQADILDGLLTLGTGAAYSREQLIGQTISYFPQYGDTKEEIAVKNDRLQRLITAARIQAGPLADEFDKSIKPLLGKTAAPPAEGAAPPPPTGTMAPVEAGQAVQTEQDIAKQQQLQQAWNSGATVEQMVQLSQQLGLRPFGEDELAVMRSQRQKGGPVNFYAEPTGAPSITQGVTGAMLSTPVGEAVGGYTTGAANALLLGGLDELAPVLGLSPQQVQAGKDYLRRQAPVSSLAGEVTGGVLGALPLVRGAQAGLAGTRFAGAAPLLGETAYGALYGAGEAPEGQRLAGAALGGGLSLGAGALANRFLPGGPGTFTGITPEVPPAGGGAGGMAPPPPAGGGAARQAPSLGRIEIREMPLDQKMYLSESGARVTVMENAKFAPRQNSITDFVVPDELQGSGLGGQILDDVLARYNPMEISAAASSDPSVALFYQRGFRPTSNPNATLDEALAIRKEDSSVTMAIPRDGQYTPRAGISTPPPAGETPMPTGAAMTREELIDLARKAVSRTPGASAARSRLAEIAKVNPEAKAAADRLGLELPVDVLSDNAQLKEVVGLTRSEIGSTAKNAWNETVQAVSDKAHEVMDEVNAITDISQVSADVFDRLNSAQMGLGKRAAALRDEVTEAVDIRGRVDASRIKEWLQGRIDDFGGGKEGLASLSPEEKKLWSIVSKGEPTYALLNEQRDLIGQALEKATGPWSNTNLRRLKEIYGALADDQIRFIETTAGKEIADKQRAANTLFKQMYDGREQMEKLFTKDLSGSLAPLMQRAITEGTKGNIKTFNTLMNIIPDDMKGKVLTSALFKAAKTTDETFSFTNFANIYRDLRANSAVYKQMAKAIGPEGEKILTDLYAVSRRLSDADKAISRTGASTQLQLLNSERLLSRILMASGGAAGAGIVGSMIGGPGMAIATAGIAAAAPEIAQKLGKTNAEKLHGLLSSTEFKDLAESAATGEDLDRNINRVANSKPFREFAKNVGIDMKQGRNWLRSAITAGGVGEFGPEGGPPEGAIVVRPQ